MERDFIDYLRDILESIEKTGEFIHDYFGVNTEVIWKTARYDIPTLKPLIEQMINEHQ